MVGFLVSWWIVALGAVAAVAFGLLWVREIGQERGLEEAPHVEPEAPAAQPAAAAAAQAPTAPSTAALLEPEPESFARRKFLEISTLGVGAAIGGLITLPVLGFTVAPAFLDQGFDDRDLGPLEAFPEGEWMIATFTAKPDQGDVSRLTAFVRYNGLLGEEPSFTMLSNHCVHLGCPTQPNGPSEAESATEFEDVTLIPTQPSGFGCPCHGGQYDNEGNRTAGPPVRALDRYSFSIKEGRLFVGQPFSVARVEGTGANAKIYKHSFAFPGVHVDGIESWLYPIQPSQIETTR
jgi:menaquinol-cytochrome c reductase iron-sulfur subunit